MSFTIADVARALSNASLPPVKGNVVNHAWLAEGAKRDVAFVGPRKPQPAYRIPIQDKRGREKQAR